jgi:replicative DNA helicase
MEKLAASGQLAERLSLEEEVIGLFLKFPSLEFGTILRDFGPPSSAYSQTIRPILKAILDLVVRGEEFDASNVISLLAEQDNLKAAGGEEYISELAGKSTSPAERFPGMVQQLRDIYHRDKLRTLLEMALVMTNSNEHKPETVVNMLQEDLSRILEISEHDKSRTVGMILDELHQRTERGIKSGFYSYETGFGAIDSTIGGISQGELIMIGGAQGVGKTIMCLQMARNISHEAKAHVLYICYEHSPEYLLKRLIPLESINPIGVTPFDQGLTERDVLQGLDRASDGRVGFLDMLNASSRGKVVLDKLLQYKDRLHLIKGDSLKTTLHSIRSMIIELKSQAKGQVVVFLDYLQKVPVFPEPDREEEKVTIITQSLKDMALSLQVPIVTVVAADREGLKAKRLHIFHLRGSSALDYEADIVLILNDKDKIISKTNVAYNPNKINEYKQYVVCTIEKNRTGRKMMDFEFKKHFKFFCFDPSGRSVQEQLIEEKLFTE